MMSDWDASLKAYERAQEIYPETRHFRDLFQYGAKWQRDPENEWLKEQLAEAFEEGVKALTEYLTPAAAPYPIRNPHRAKEN